jgi:hypothetical protein
VDVSTVQIPALLPRLENDRDGIHRRLISDALRSQFSKDEIEVLLVDRTITIEESERPQEAVKKGHEQAAVRKVSVFRLEGRVDGA